MNYARLFAGLALVGLVACVKTPPNPEVDFLKKKILGAKTELVTLQKKLHDSGDDHGLKNQLAEDQELLKSRISRWEDRWKQIQPDSPPPSLPNEGKEDAKH